MALEKQTIEILLNGGLNTKTHTEAQNPPDFVELKNFHFDKAGRLAKVRCDGSGVSVAPDAASPWTESEDALSLFKRGNDIGFISRNHGAGKFLASQNSQYLYVDIDKDFGSGSTSIVKPGPVQAEVSRGILHSAQFSNKSQGIFHVAASQVSTTVFVVGWVELTTTGGEFYARAYYVDPASDASGVTQYSQVTESWTLSGTFHYVSSAGGTITFVTDSGGAPYTIRSTTFDVSTRRWSAATTLTTNAKFLPHAYSGSDATAYFSFCDNTSGNMVVQTISGGSVVATHNATHPLFGPATVLNLNNVTVVFSMASSSEIYAEVLGSPGTAVVINSSGASETFYGVTASQMAGGTATIDYATVYTLVGDTGVLGAPALNLEMQAVRITIGGTITDGPLYDIPNTYNAAAAVQVNGRSYIPIVVDRAYNLSTEIVPGSCILCRAYAAWSGGSAIAHPVARFGHDRTQVFASLFSSSSGSWVTNDGIAPVVHVVTLGDQSSDKTVNYDGKPPQTIFYHQIKLQDAALPVPSVDQQDVATIASGMLWEYDGVRAYEAQPLRNPRIFQSGASGSILCRAIYTFVDSAGRLHRSSSSNTLSITAGNTVYVEKPALSAFSVNPELSVELYCSTGTGSAMYLANTATSRRDDYDATTTNGLFWEFTSVQAGSAANPPAYWNSGELESEPPPSFHDVRVVGDRMFGVDAEDRTRWWASKPFVSQYGVEWNTIMTGHIGDQIEAVVDMSGVPTFLGRTGVYQIYGPGPNQFGVGNYSQPKLVSQTGCVSRNSVCQTKHGVVFQTVRGFVMLDQGMQIQEIGQPVFELTRSAVFGAQRVIYDEQYDELRVCGRDTTYYYSFISGGWSRNTETVSVHDVIYNPRGFASNKLVKSRDDGNLYIETATTSAEDSEWETPWIKLDGLSGYGRLWRVILTVRTPNQSLSANISYTIRMSTDFGGVTSQYNFTGSEMGLWPIGDVVDLKLRPRKQRVKAFKLNVQSTGSLVHNGIVPLSIRIEYGADPAQRTSTGRRVAPTSGDS